MEHSSGTSDLAWCDRVRREHFFEKAGWPKYEKMRYPFLVDTNLFISHIANNGVQYPIEIPKEFLPDPKKKKEEMSVVQNPATKL